MAPKLLLLLHGAGKQGMGAERTAKNADCYPTRFHRFCSAAVCRARACFFSAVILLNHAKHGSVPVRYFKLLGGRVIHNLDFKLCM